ncbi:matrixin family metalloprotease [Chondromyces crocatus]|uniref:Peptidase M10 metallopeptidase domain-containing protein n=1 Tax=Chondromyces crocatus TaxID=52 RepID=A0A0K1EJI7_CHOCO|nr:matrixin family metalloprotease [Chondromyces crocatus]AKT41024.1 uncharacterized protein CMC5_051820 [Chondromyces crocatus]
MKSAEFRRAWVLGSALVALLASTRDASAYCRTSVCGDVENYYTGARCDPPMPDDCGTPIAWPEPCMGFSVQADASRQVSYEEAVNIFETAFDTWMNADCGDGLHPRLNVSNAGAVSCTEHEFNQGKGRGNANAILFRDDGWPHAGAAHTLALTLVTYSVGTARIYDADMEINTAIHTFSTGDDDVQYDLLSVVTHETGHFLGLSHSFSDVEATMVAQYPQGSIALRDLSKDDEEAICVAYPPGPILSCDPTPRGGFSPLCEGEQLVVETDDEGCSVSAAGSSRTERGGLVAALGMLALLGTARRRRARTR